MNAPNEPNSTCYVIAVSGGVDSMVLLHKLAHEEHRVHYVVAHVNHGIRKDSHEDEALVRDQATTYGMEFESVSLNLGEGASEELARAKRYEFLRSIQNKYKAKAIITAHHQDDVIETAFINIVRGTGRRGLTSLDSHDSLVRPMLSIPKSEIRNYATKHNLKWNEDVTNLDTKILRNNIRHNVVARLSDEQRQQILCYIEETKSHNTKIQKELNNLMQGGLHKGKPVLSRGWLRRLTHELSKEVVHSFLLQNGATEIDRYAVDRIVVGIKTLSAGKTLQASGVDILLTKRSARIKKRSKTD